MRPEERALAAIEDCSGGQPGYCTEHVRAALRFAIAEEREACATLLDGLGCSDWCSGDDHDARSCYQTLAAKMRARP